MKAERSSTELSLTLTLTSRADLGSPNEYTVSL
jgi:hypothetical protein